MGNNQAFTTVERQLIGFYDVHALTPKVLDIICEGWRGTDIDLGGYKGLKAKNGLNVFYVVAEVLRTTIPEPEGDPELIVDNEKEFEWFIPLSEQRWG